jgi:16S rRNA (cytidine1402-2'-O)-methyltransferase
VSNTGETGILYIVATPIGNLEDMSVRARRILGEVDLVAAEDTRHSRRLLDHFGIRATLIALHEHNERVKTQELIAELEHGRSIAVISDAGTPLISDPGFDLVRAARAAGVRVVPVPGPSAVIAALSASGLPSDRFAFEGFPPTKSAARRAVLERLVNEPRTLIFYETPHRIAESLEDMAAVFGSERGAVLAREITKQFETIRGGTLEELARWVASDPDQQRGEIVVLVRGAAPVGASLDAEAERVLRLLLAELPLKQAANLAAKITGVKKNVLYHHALTLAGSD